MAEYDQGAGTREKRLKWFQDARFGMFVHWGLYAQLGRHEWVMNRERIPVKEYEKLAATFKPKPRAARQWAALAKAAGLSEVEARVLVGLLKRNGWAEIGKGAAGPELTPVKPVGDYAVGKQFRALRDQPAAVAASPELAQLVERGLAAPLKLTKRTFHLLPAGNKVAASLSADDVAGMILEERAGLAGGSGVPVDGGALGPALEEDVDLGAGGGSGDEPAKPGTGPQRGTGGGAGGGAKARPVAVLVFAEDGVSVLPIADKSGKVDRLLEKLPGLVERFKEVGAGKS